MTKLDSGTFINSDFCHDIGLLNSLSMSWYIIHANSEIDQFILNLLGSDPTTVNSPPVKLHNHGEWNYYILQVINLV